MLEKTDKTDGWTDEWMPDHNILLTARHGQCNKKPVRNVKMKGP